MACLITWSWRLHCLSYSFAICHSRNSNAPQQTSIVCRKIAPRCYNMLRRRGGCPNFMLFVWVGWGGVGAITFRCTCTQQSWYANSESDNQDNQVASRTTGRGASQPARSRVSQPGHKSANQVASQTTGRESANRSQVSQPCRESTNQVASQTTRTHAGHEKKRNEMRGGRERT